MKTFLDVFEEGLNTPLSFSLLVTLQALLGSRGVALIPKRLTRIADTPLSRFVILVMIAYTATQQLEYSILTVMTLVILFWFLRTEDEKESDPPI